PLLTAGQRKHPRDRPLRWQLASSFFATGRKVVRRWHLLTTNRWIDGHSAAVGVLTSGNYGAATVSAAIRASHYHPAAIRLLQTITHLHALPVIGAFGSNLYQSISL